uniref:Uncharacterized protein n=1 Tax=Octopus bimaculoides TaxID=37653 RepID=A0A0L8H739_OCTBM
MKSPAEMLNSRKYKITQPTKIQPPIDQEKTRAKLAATQEQGQKYYNKHAQNLPEILGEQHAHTQDPMTKTWIPAQVVSRAKTPRLCIIETESGRQLRRNRDHFCPTPAASVATPTRTTTPTTDDDTYRMHASTDSSSQQASTTHQQPNNTSTSCTTPQASAQSTVKSIRWRPNILPLI